MSVREVVVGDKASMAYAWRVICIRSYVELEFEVVGVEEGEVFCADDVVTDVDVEVEVSPSLPLPTENPKT